MQKQDNDVNNASEKRVRMHYEGSIFWPIFWLIIFFPFAFILLLTKCRFEINDKIYGYKYNGTSFWLYFWTIVFFPITFLLLFLNGAFVVKDINM